MESHYCRASTAKLYLEPIWQSKKHVYEEYKLWSKNKEREVVSITTFHEIFEDLNLSLFRPKKDQCEMCVAYNTQNLDEQTYSRHITLKNKARDEKNRDKEDSTKKVFTMDLQSVLLCPKSNVSSLYYRMKLIVHNFTIFDLSTHDGFCFLWHEGEGSVSSNEFASILSNFIEKKVLPNLKPNQDVVLYSDGCAAQNRNVTLSNALINLAIQHQINIEQKYLEKGHTQMEADSMHSTIERKLKNMIINVPADYIQICQNARHTPFPYKVEYLSHKFFKNFSSLKFLKSIRPGYKSGDPTVNQLRALRYCKHGSVDYKLQFSDPWSPLPQRRITAELCAYELLPRLYENPPKITADKYQHLQHLKTSLEKDYHAFYDELPH